MDNSETVLKKMDGYIQDWKSCKDGRYVFLSCYHMMSSNMVVALNAAQFNDNAWVRKLLNRFADYYFESLTCFDCGDQTPKVWEHAHKATCNKDLSELQFLILGVNAHINYDLVLALYDLLQPEWNTLTGFQKEQRFKDHCYVNQVIAQTIDRVQDEVLEPINPKLNWIDTLMGRLDEFLISKLITSWRGQVWEHTQELLTLTTAHEREAYRLKLEQEVLERANTISRF